MTARLPSLRGIEAFVAVAETLNFRQAAERLNISVSAVSHRIHVLEEELRVELFDRSGRAVTLTTVGARYRDTLLPRLKALQQATELIWSDAEGPTLRIATFPQFYSSWLAPRLGTFLGRHPTVRLEMMTLGVRHAGKPDIVLGPASGPRLRARVRHGDHKLFDWSIAPVCHPDLIAEHAITTPADLLKVQLIEMASALDSWPRWFECAELPREFPRTSLIIDSLVPPYDAAIQKLGVALAPRPYMPSLRAAGLVRPFDLYCRYPGGVYVGAAEGPERPIVETFRAWVIAEAEEGVSNT